MCNRLRWSTLALFLALMAVAPSFADTAAPAVPLSIGQTHSVLPDSLRPAVTPAVDTSLTQLQPVQVARVPSYSITTPTVLTAGTQPIGFQGSGSPSNNRHLRWAMYGAAIGLAVGLIDGDNEITNTLIGAGVGLGLSFVIRR
jgi:hypothetical protein